MAWTPTARLKTYALGTVVLPDDLNDLQDEIVHGYIGTNSYRGFVLDGTGGAVVAAAVRTVEATGGALVLLSVSGVSVTSGGLTVVAGGLTTNEAAARHANAVLQLGATAGHTQPLGGPGAATISTSAQDVFWIAGASGQVVAVEIPLKVGDRIKSLTMYGRSTAAFGWELRLWRVASNPYSTTQVGGTQTSPAGAGPSSVSLAALTETIVAGTRFYATWTSLATLQELFLLEVTYDRIA